MKKTLIAAASVALTLGAYAQGTVSFQDATITPKIYVGTAASSSLAPQKTFSVSLYWASASGGTLAPIFTGVANVAADGDFYFTTAVATPTQTAVGGTAEFEVVGWTGTYADLATAQANKAAFGMSAPFLNGTGGADPAGAPLNLTGWTGNVLMTSAAPEPTTLALGGIGAAALLLFRRRK